MKLPEIESLAISKIADHLPNQGWRFRWNNSVTFLGMCSYRTKTIVLSKRWMVAIPEAEVLDTILHEIAHALTPKDGGHGREWKLACKLIGANPNRLHDGDTKVHHVALPKYQMIDSTTGKVLQNYYRMPSGSTFRKLRTSYIKGRREETIGKLVIREVPLMDLL